MTKTKQEIINQICWGVDFFQGFEYEKSEVDMFQIFEWNSDHPILPKTIDELDAKVIVEVGVFIGGSVIKMAEKLREKGDGCIIAIDDFHGDQMLWDHSGVKGRMRREFGRPNFWRTFYANIIESGLKDYVVPINMGSFSALRMLNGKHRGVSKLRQGQVDMIHIDASHVSPMPYLDVQESWDLVKTGGAIIIDDWCPNQQTIDHDGANFLGIWNDITKFCSEKKVQIEHDLSVPKPFKCRFFKNV